MGVRARYCPAGNHRYSAGAPCPLTEPNYRGLEGRIWHLAKTTSSWCPQAQPPALGLAGAHGRMWEHMSMAPKATEHHGRYHKPPKCFSGHGQTPRCWDWIWQGTMSPRMGAGPSPYGPDPLLGVQGKPLVFIGQLSHPCSHDYSRF